MKITMAKLHGWSQFPLKLWNVLAEGMGEEAQWFSGSWHSPSCKPTMAAIDVLPQL
jgi:hypothetical protein